MTELHEEFYENEFDFVKLYLFILMFTFYIAIKALSIFVFLPSYVGPNYLLNMLDFVMFTVLAYCGSRMMSPFSRNSIWPKTSINKSNFLILTIFSINIFAIILTGKIALTRFMYGFNQYKIDSESTLDLQGMIGIVVFWPIIEEFIFRGVILNGLSSKYGFTLANFASSILFGLAHLEPSKIVICTASGFMLGLLFQKTRCLPACMAVHIFHNFLVLASHSWPALVPVLLVPVVATPLFTILWQERQS